MASTMNGRLRDIFALRLYSRVARLGSFSAAAKECGLSQPQASRIIADLEADLDVKLFRRTTRAVVPTEAGYSFLSKVEPIVAALDEAELSVRDDGELRGAVRLSMPTSVGVREIIPRLAAFTKKHPLLQVHFLLEDRRQDLVRDAVDVAIRLGRQTDSTATTKLIATIPRKILASPVYLAERGVPTLPSELESHRIVSGPAAAVPSAWVFEKNGETQSLDLKPHFITNENEGAVAAAAAGLGVTSTSGWACRRELSDGSLISLFDEWETQPIPVFAYYQMGKATASAARALVDYLVQDISSSP